MTITRPTDQNDELYLRQFNEAVKTINSTNNREIRYDADRFRDEWLDRFINKDEAVRAQWINEVTKDAYSPTLLVKEGEAVAVVPPMFARQTQFILDTVSMPVFWQKYVDGKNYANGHRSKQVMDTLIQHGLVRNRVDLTIMTLWALLYRYFDVNTEWCDKVFAILDEKGVKIHSQDHTTKQEERGDGYEFEDI